MFGQNKILKPENHAGENLDIVEIFPTLQGEGPYAGHPAVFIRLGGCNLACSFCDTAFDEYVNMSLDQILTKVVELSLNKHQERSKNLVVITGGEPMRQPIELLCSRLIECDFLVQIESNGTIYRNLPKDVKMICSPKVTNGQYHAIRPDLLPHINAFKFIISKNRTDYHDIAQVGQEKYNIPIYLQPMDEKDEVINQRNLAYTAHLCQENGYILSLQQHKIVGIR